MLTETSALAAATSLPLSALLPHNSWLLDAAVATTPSSSSSPPSFQNFGVAPGNEVPPNFLDLLELMSSLWHKLPAQFLCSGEVSDEGGAIALTSVHRLLILSGHSMWEELLRCIKETVQAFWMLIYTEAGICWGYMCQM